MIVRILGDGQYDVPEAALDQLNDLDEELQHAIDAGEVRAFEQALARLLAEVRGIGSRIPDALLTASDLVLPGADSTLEDVAALVGDEGLIPG